VSSIDPTNPEKWGPAVERAAEAIARATWGASHWYRGAANDALTAAFQIDPKDTQRVLRVWLNDL
jgi:hypothetical protein